METREEAIAYLMSRGFHAQALDWFGAGTLGVASEAEEVRYVDEEPITVLKHLVAIMPVGGAWVLRSHLPEETTFSSLGEAVEAAAALVSRLRDDPRKRREGTLK